MEKESCGIAGFVEGGKELWVKEHRRPVVAEKGKETFSARASRKEQSHADTMV